MTEIIDVTPDSFENLVLKAELPVLVDVWADWCGPCKAMKPIIKALAEEYADRVKFVMLNGGEDKEFIRSLEVRSVPTFIIFEGGERKAILAGMKNIDQMRTFINGQLEKSKASSTDAAAVHAVA